MKTYRAQRAILHNGMRYDEGDPIELDDKDAGPLLDAGAVKPSATKKKPEPKEGGGEKK